MALLPTIIELQWFTTMTSINSLRDHRYKYRGERSISWPPINAINYDKSSSVDASNYIIIFLIDLRNEFSKAEENFKHRPAGLLSSSDGRYL